MLPVIWQQPCMTTEYCLQDNMPVKDAVQRVSLFRLKLERNLDWSTPSSDAWGQDSQLQKAGHMGWLLLAMFRLFRVGRLLSKRLLITSSCLVWIKAMRGPGEPPLIPACISIAHQSFVGSYILELAARHSPGSELWLTYAPLPLYKLWNEFWQSFKMVGCQKANKKNIAADWTEIICTMTSPKPELRLNTEPRTNARNEKKEN